MQWIRELPLDVKQDMMIEKGIVPGCKTRYDEKGIAPGCKTRYDEMI